MKIDFITVETLNIMDFHGVFEGEGYDLIYTSAACGGLFDFKLLFLALVNNAGLLCNKATVDNLKKCCSTIKQVTSKIAQAEVYKNGPSTDADISGGSENLQKRDIYFVNIHLIHEQQIFDDTLHQFEQCVLEQDKMNRSLEKNINQTWFSKLFDRLKAHFNANQSFENQIFSLDLNCTYWGNFLKEENKIYRIDDELLQSIVQFMEGKRPNDKLWRKVKEMLCEGIITYLNNVVPTIHDFFSISQNEVENKGLMDQLIPDIDISIIVQDKDELEDESMDNLTCI